MNYPRDRDTLNPVIFQILRVTYFLAYPLILISFFLPYYIIGGETYYRFSPDTIFPWFYTILTFIIIIANAILMYRVHTNVAKKSDLFSLILLNVFLLLERVWQPLINNAITSTPEIASGLFIMHLGLFLQFMGVVVYYYVK